MSRSLRSLVICASVVVGLGQAPTLARPRQPAMPVEPGAATMSAEEMSIVVDAASGREHAVVLLEETSVVDRRSGAVEIAYHLRAKILSSEGRQLANMEIRHTKRGKLTRWWGRTILPDGRVLELPRDQLASQTLLRFDRPVRDAELRVFRGALPGVVPGAVIDYGYVLVDVGPRPFRHVPIQRRWPVESFRFHWAPNETLGNAVKILNDPRGRVEWRREEKGVLVTASGLAPLVHEPAMPPERQVQIGVLFSYFPAGTEFGSYWDDHGRRIDAALSRFLADDRAIRDVIASWGPDDGGTLETRLREAYEWVGAHVRDTCLLSSEELEASPSRTGSQSEAAAVLARGEGSRFEIAALYAGFARALGAEASLVLTSDRRGVLWDPGVHSMEAFDSVAVAVRTTGEGGGGDRLVVADPGSGLPYGSLPWWATGVTALRTGPSGAQVLTIAPSDPTRNVGTTKALLAFSDAGDRVLADWTRTGTGQVGLVERRELRRLPPQDRQERIDALCRPGAGVELLSAEVRDLEAPFGDLVLDCSAELEAMALDGPADEIRFSLDGPWIEPILELGSSASRVHPVVFDFPRIETATFEISAPEGFASDPAPPPVSLQTGHGNYWLSVHRTPYGYRVERRLSMLPLQVPPKEVAALRAFLEEVRRADRTPLTFRRTGPS